jgi:flagellar basal-body rod modification protein FlgD
MQTSLFGNSSAAATTTTPPASTNPLANTTGEMADMFTRLLVAQIKNQDPLSPSDPSQFVNQLTQLSQTESLQSLAKITSANAGVLQSMQILAMGAQVGSEVSVRAGSVTLDGTPVSGSIALPDATPQATLVLTGADGTQHPVDLGPRSAGEAPFTIDPAALGLAPGSYILAVNAGGVRSNAAISVAGKIASVRVGQNGDVALNVAHVGEIAPSAIIAFNGTR